VLQLKNYEHLMYTVSQQKLHHFIFATTLSDQAPFW